MRFLATIFISMSLSIGLAGCSKGSGSRSPANAVQDPTAEIRTAVLAHLAQKGTLDLQSFDTNVKQVTIQTDHAQAEVEFRAKNGPGVMSITYQLQKREETWGVVETNPVGSDFSHPSLSEDQASTPAGPGGSNSSLADTIRSFTFGDAGVPSPTTPTPAPR